MWSELMTAATKVHCLPAELLLPKERKFERVLTFSHAWQHMLCKLELFEVLGGLDKVLAPDAQ